MGQPSMIDDRMEEETRAEEEKQRNPDWQDPNLLKELKAATGVDLKMPIKRGKGEHFEDINFTSRIPFTITQSLDRSSFTSSFIAFFIYRQRQEYKGKETAPRTYRHS